MRTLPYLRDKSGAVIVEVGLLAPIVMVVLVAVVQLSVFVWQWNTAQRATRAGVRLASMSAPVSSEITSLANATPGTSAGDYSISCDGSTRTCSSGTYNANAMNRILTGGDGVCGTQTQTYLRGLCDMFPDITEANILIEYDASLNEVSGAPGGLQPIITLHIRNLPLDYTPLAMFGGTRITLPETSAISMAQDLSEGGWSS